MFSFGVYPHLFTRSITKKKEKKRVKFCHNNWFFCLFCSACCSFYWNLYCSFLLLLLLSSISCWCFCLFVEVDSKRGISTRGMLIYIDNRDSTKILPLPRVSIFFYLVHQLINHLGEYYMLCLLFLLLLFFAQEKVCLLYVKMHNLISFLFFVKWPFFVCKYLVYTKQKIIDCQ